MIRLTESGVHAREIKEVFHPGNPGVWVNPEWESRFPWLAQGITGRGGPDGKAPRNFARFTDPPAKGVRHAWAALRVSLDFPRIAHSRQIHGRQVSIYEWSPSDTIPEEDDPQVEEGHMILGPDADGHLTGSPGVLLAVTVADCVPVYLVDPERKVVGLLHAGWRGTVVGVLERGIGLISREFGTRPEELTVHFGPAVCGDCYEVGPEVHNALGLPDPGEPTPVDIRGHLAARALEMGVLESGLSQSAWCTLCEGSPFFSHRRGDAARQVGFLGVRLPSEE